MCILTPVGIAAWPQFSAAVAAAATSLGYAIAAERTASAVAAEQTGRVELQIEQSELVTDKLARDQRIAVTRNGVTVTFSRDARGRASLCVTGAGFSREELRAQGEELSQRVVQQYVYQRLMEEIRARRFIVVEEQTDSHHASRLKVRHWEN